MNDSWKAVGKWECAFSIEHSHHHKSSGYVGGELVHTEWKSSLRLSRPLLRCMGSPQYGYRNLEREVPLEFSYWFEQFVQSHPEAGDDVHSVEEVTAVLSATVNVSIAIKPEEDSLWAEVSLELTTRRRRQCNDSTAEKESVDGVWFEGTRALPAEPMAVELELVGSRCELLPWEQPPRFKLELRPVLSYSVIQVVDEADEERPLSGVPLRVADAAGNALTLVTDEKGEISLLCPVHEQFTLMGLPGNEEEDKVLLAAMDSWELKNA